MQAISRVRHTDKYQCVRLCIEKEKEGFDCIKPIQRVNNYNKQYRYDGYSYAYDGYTDDGYWEAVYRKRFYE